MDRFIVIKTRYSTFTRHVFVICAVVLFGSKTVLHYYEEYHTNIRYPTPAIKSWSYAHVLSPKMKPYMLTPKPNANDRGRTCQTALGNVMFIKTHKTGSTTLQSVLNRYGYLRNLSFVIDRNNLKNGHVRYKKLTTDTAKKMFVPALGQSATYNMSTIHIVFNHKLMQTFMSPNTKYITIIRDPISQFISAFYFFNIGRAVPSSSTEKLKDFLAKPVYHWNRFHNNMRHYARNNQIHDLGLDFSGFDNKTIIHDKILQLSKQLDLVLINEYFDESLILLKKELCWNFDDILYVSKNQRNQSLHPIDDEDVTKINEYMMADRLLYDFFNNTFWLKVSEYGPSFREDLQTFRNLNNDTKNDCAVLEETVTFKKTIEYKPTVNASVWCRYLAQSDPYLFKLIFQRQNTTFQIEK